MGNDLSVVNAARVSFDKHHETFTVDDTKLIKYLAKHEHFSPFNHSYITVRVKAPLFVARQLVKHEYMPWNEVSRRYVDDEPEFYMPEVWRASADNVKQGSSDQPHHLWNRGVGTGYIDDILELYGDVFMVYNRMIEDGVAPEQARMVLPQSMYTEWYWSGTLKAFSKMYNLRIDAHTQKETQEVAEQIGDIIKPLFPVSWEALTKKDN